MTPKQITLGDRPTGVEYSKICPWNSDCTLLLLLASTPTSILDHFALHRGDGTFQEALLVGASERPRWSRTNPTVFYFLRDNKFCSYDLESSVLSVLRVFSEYSTIISGSVTGEMDISRDGDHVVLCGDGHDVFLYEISTERKGPVSFQSESFDAVALGPSNQIILSKASGIWDLSTGRRLVPYDAHAATCRDANGDDCLIYARSDDKNAVTKVRLSDGQPTELLDLGWSAFPPDSMAVNISTCDDPHFCLVATYGRDKTVKYANQILKVQTDGSGVEVLCDHGDILRDDESQPKAALSRDGSRFVYRVDDGSAVNTWLGMLDDAVPVSPPPETLTDVNFRGSHGKWHVAFDIDVVNDVPVVKNFRMQDRS